MEVITLATVIALVLKIVDTLKMLLARDASAVTQCLAWLVGVGAAFVTANSDFGEAWDVGLAQPLGELNAWSLVLLGLCWASGASVLVAFKRAFDNSDSDVVPSLGDRLNNDPDH